MSSTAAEVLSPTALPLPGSPFAPVFPNTRTIRWLTDEQAKEVGELLTSWNAAQRVCLNADARVQMTLQKPDAPKDTVAAVYADRQNAYEVLQRIFEARCRLEARICKDLKVTPTEGYRLLSDAKTGRIRIAVNTA